MARPLILTRRSFVSSVLAAGAALAAGSTTPGFAFTDGIVSSSGAGMVSFHLDRPYIDWTGTAEPYSGPNGLRSGQAVAYLSDEEFRRLCWCS